MSPKNAGFCFFLQGAGVFGRNGHEFPFFSETINLLNRPSVYISLITNPNHQSYVKNRAISLPVQPWSVVECRRAAPQLSPSRQWPASFLTQPLSQPPLHAPTHARR